MSAREAPGTYRVEELRRASDGTPRWGIRRPDGTWEQSMGQPQWCVCTACLQRIADERNRVNGLV